jgi:hypothetical protein
VRAEKLPYAIQDKGRMTYVRRKKKKVRMWKKVRKRLSREVGCWAPK